MSFFSRCKKLQEKDTDRYSFRKGDITNFYYLPDINDATTPERFGNEGLQTPRKKKK